MYKLLLFFALQSTSLSAQYLIKLEIEHFSSEFDCELIFYLNDLQNLNAKNIFSEIEAITKTNNKNKFDSLLFKIGIPLINPGFSDFTSKCSKLDSLSFDLNAIFKKNNLVFEVRQKEIFYSIKLKFLKFNGELCISAPSSQVWSDMPLFPMIGTIITLNRIESISSQEKKFLSIEGEKYNY